MGTLQETQFPKPRFHIIMLFIDEEESVRRQLLRGQRSIAHNAEVEASGVGDKWEVRKTDLDEDAAHLRYKTFKESTYDSLTTLRKLFHYHFINAHGSVIEVQQRIIQELKYQSSLNWMSQPMTESRPYHSRINYPSCWQLWFIGLILTRNFTPKFLTVSLGLSNQNSYRLLKNTNLWTRVHQFRGFSFDDPLAIAILIGATERGFTAVVDIDEWRFHRIDPKV